MLAEYGLKSVTGDKYAGETFRQDFQRKGFSYRVCELSKSEIYEEFEPILNGGRVVLLDHANLESQLLGLVWRANRIDHQGGEHDDFANSCCGAVWLANEHKVVNRHAAPVGVGKITSPFGNALATPMPWSSTFGPVPDEQRPGKGGAWLYGFDWGDNAQEEGGYISRTGRRRKFPSED